MKRQTHAARLNDQPTAVFQLFTADGSYLYSGITNNPRRTLAQHVRSEPWWPTVAERRFTWFPTRSAAMAAEAALGGRGVMAKRTRVAVRRFPHQPRCGHRTYHLSCEQYECLIERAQGYRCEICRSAPQGTGPRETLDHIGLVLDHDHSLGFRAVRGLACPSCNAVIREVERGRRDPDQRVKTFLESPWYAEAEIDPIGCPTDCTYGSHRREASDRTRQATSPGPVIAE